MKYVLDFDDCIFNTEELRRMLKVCDLNEADRDEETFTKIRAYVNPETGERPYKDFDFKSLVFPDALEFLMSHKNDCIILTSATSVKDTGIESEKARIAFQNEKLKEAGILELGVQFRVVPDSKLEALTELKAQMDVKGEPFVFVDDNAAHIRDAASLEICAVTMERYGAGSFEALTLSERLDVISSFHGLTERAQKLWDERHVAEPTAETS